MPSILASVITTANGYMSCSLKDNLRQIALILKVMPESPEVDLAKMQEDIKAKVAGVQDTDSAVVVTARKHKTCIDTARREGNVNYARFNCAASTNCDITVTEFEALINDSACFETDNFFFNFKKEISE